MTPTNMGWSTVAALALWIVLSVMRRRTSQTDQTKADDDAKIKQGDAAVDAHDRDAFNRDITGN